MVSVFGAIAGENEPSLPGPTDDWWYEETMVSASGIRVTPMSAMRASACYACVKVLSETIASIPRIMCELMNDGTVEQRFQHPLQHLMELSPNDRQTAFEFWEMQIAFGCLFGNSYALIVPGARGAVDQLIPLRPDHLTTYLLVNGRIRYEYTDPLTGVKSNYTQDEVFKIPGFSFNGIEGIAPIFFAQDPIGLALATEQFGSRFFSSDATPSIVLTHPKVLQPGTAGRIQQSWRNRFGGVNKSHGVAVLEEGIEVKTLSSANKDSQFIETRKYQIAEICRYLRVPLHMVNELEKSSFSNIEQQSIEFVKYTIRPWLRRIEQRVRKDLVASPKFIMRHDLNDLMQGEMKDRFGAYQVAATTGFFTRNEIRRMEGLNPLPGLDKPLTPLNMGGANGEGGANNDPKPGRTPQGGNDAIRSACRVAVEDVFTRIAASEVENVKTVCKKNASADDEELETALSVYYETKLTPYMVKSLRAVTQMCADLGLQVPSAEAYAASYREERIAAVLDAADRVVYLDNWLQTAGVNLTHGWFAEGEKVHETL